MLKDPIYTKTTNVVHFEKEELNCEKVIKIQKKIKEIINKAMVIK